MRCLFLDLASHHGLLACVEDRFVVASHAIDHRIGDHELLPLFETVLQESGWQARDLTHCGCVVGPGGFMSLRVAVAFANTLIHQLKIPGAGIHLSDVFAARASYPSLDSGPHPALRATLSREEKQEGRTSFLWLHSTKKNELFVRGFGEYAQLWPEATHVTTEEFLETLLPSSGAPRHPLSQGGEGTAKTLYWVGELLPEHETLFSHARLRPADLRLVAEVLPAFLQKQIFTNTLLQPWYGREG